MLIYQQSNLKLKHLIYPIISTYKTAEMHQQSTWKVLQNKHHMTLQEPSAFVNLNKWTTETNISRSLITLLV